MSASKTATKGLPPMHPGELLREDILPALGRPLPVLTPTFSPRRDRISSGITTCPLDDRVVVAASVIGPRRMSYR